jgi:hypothetical protein
MAQSKIVSSCYAHAKEHEYKEVDRPVLLSVEQAGVTKGQDLKLQHKQQPSELRRSFDSQRLTKKNTSVQRPPEAFKQKTFLKAYRELIGGIENELSMVHLKQSTKLFHVHYFLLLF